MSEEVKAEVAEAKPEAPKVVREFRITIDENGTLALQDISTFSDIELLGILGKAQHALLEGAIRRGA